MSVLQRHSLFWDSGHGHIVESEPRSSGFRSCCRSAGILYLLSATFTGHIPFSDCLSSVSAPFITTPQDPRRRTSSSARPPRLIPHRPLRHFRLHPWTLHPDRSGLPQRSLPWPSCGANCSQQRDDSTWLGWEERRKEMSGKSYISMWFCCANIWGEGAG